jgi:hypothetical protein
MVGAMERNRNVKLLAMAKKHAREGTQQIARQKRIIAVLKLKRRDPQVMINVLESSLALQAYAEKQILRLEHQLAAMDAVQVQMKRWRDVS